MPDSLPRLETSSWAMCGIAALEIGLSVSVTVGTSRQPSTLRRSSTAIFSMVMRAMSRSSSAVGRNAMPTA